MLKRKAARINFILFVEALLILITFGCYDLISADTRQSEKNTPINSLSNKKYPAHWRSSFVSEPVFNGKLHIVEAGKNHKQIIILVHGLGQTGLDDWLNVIPALENNFHVISFDLPGFGRSDGNKSLYSPSNYSRLIHWIVKRFTTEKIIIMGHSMGGAISLRFTHDYQDEVSKLILVDVAGILFRPVFTKHLIRAKSDKLLNQSFNGFTSIDSFIDYLGLPIYVMGEKLLESSDGRPNLSKFLLENDLSRKYILKDRSALNAALSLLEEDFSRAIGEIKVPTHIIWGEQDPVAPLRTGKILAELMENASLTVLPGIGHVPMNEEPIQFNRILLRKLKESSFQSRRLPAIPLNDLEDTDCAHRNNILLVGNYRNIIINGCEDARLENIFSRSITIINSSVILDNVRVLSSGIALYAMDSKIEGTLLSLNGEKALKVERSQIDMAGSSLTGKIDIIEIKNNSKIYFSVSKGILKDQKFDLHGDYSSGIPQLQ